MKVVAVDSVVWEEIASRLRPECRDSYRSERLQFVIKEFAVAEVRSDFSNDLKDRVKHRFGAICPFLTSLLSPVYGQVPVPSFLKSASPGEFIVNLTWGS